MIFWAHFLFLKFFENDVQFFTTFAQLSARLKKKGLVIGFGPKVRLGKMCNSVVILKDKQFESLNEFFVFIFTV